MADLGAILTAIVTPFDDGLRVDEDAFVELLRHLCAHGSDGVVVCGTTGEAPTLSDEEHLRLIELAVQERPEGATVVAGTRPHHTPPPRGVNPPGARDGGGAGRGGAPRPHKTPP